MFKHYSKPVKYLQNFWLFLSAFNLIGTKTRLSYDETVTRVQQGYAFHKEASLKVQGTKGSTSQTQGPDGTLERLSLTLRGLTSNGKRQTAKMTSEFVLVSSNPSLNHIKIEKCLPLFTPNTNIFTLLFKELNTDGKSFIFAVCCLT